MYSRSAMSFEEAAAMGLVVPDRALSPLIERGLYQAARRCWSNGAAGGVGGRGADCQGAGRDLFAGVMN